MLYTLQFHIFKDFIFVKKISIARHGEACL